MTEHVMMIRVAAVDLSGMIEEQESLRQELHKTYQDAANQAKAWSGELNELLEQFNRFRRAVQEATGLDQPELLHDDELVERIRRLCHPVVTVSGEVISDMVSPVEIPALFRAAGLGVSAAEATANAEANAQLVKDVFAPMVERDPVVLADGTLARVFTDQRPGEDGPPTESMPPVQESPEIDVFG